MAAREPLTPEQAEKSRVYVAGLGATIAALQEKLAVETEKWMEHISNSRESKALAAGTVVAALQAQVAGLQTSLQMHLSSLPPADVSDSPGALALAERRLLSLAFPPFIAPTSVNRVLLNPFFAAVKAVMVGNGIPLSLGGKAFLQSVDKKDLEMVKKVGDAVLGLDFPHSKSALLSVFPLGVDVKKDADDYDLAARSPGETYAHFLERLVSLCAEVVPEVAPDNPDYRRKVMRNTHPEYLKELTKEQSALLDVPSLIKALLAIDARLVQLGAPETRPPPFATPMAALRGLPAPRSPLPSFSSPGPSSTKACYKCGVVGHLAHNCQGKPGAPKVFMAHLTDDDLPTAMREGFEEQHRSLDIFHQREVEVFRRGKEAYPIAPPGGTVSAYMARAEHAAHEDAARYMDELESDHDPREAAWLRQEQLAYAAARARPGQ
jgi:hypothetical protein